MQVAQRLRHLLEQPVPSAIPRLTAYTVSLGMATLAAGEPFSVLLGRVDAAL